MALNLLPLNTLGAIENSGVVTFGLWLPWVSAADGKRRQREGHPRARPIPAGESPPRISAHPQRPRAARRLLVGDGPDRRHAARSAGRPGDSRAATCIATDRQPERRRARLDHRSVRARVRGRTSLSAFTLGYQPLHVERAASAGWRTPALDDLVLYEVNIAELAGDLERTRDLMAYLADLGVNADRGDAALERRRLGRLGLSADRLLRRRRAAAASARTSSSSSTSRTSTASP